MLLKQVFWNPGLLAMECLGLALEWENSVGLRTRMREEKKLLIYPDTEQYCAPNRVNAVTNGLVLIPVLTRLGKTANHRLPHLDDLVEEVGRLFQKCGLSLGDKASYKCSVEIKKLAGFVKRRSARKEVTKERVFAKCQPVLIGSV